MDFYSISEKRQTQIEDFLKSPLTVGEEVYVTDNYFSSYKRKRDEWRIYKVLAVNETTLTFTINKKNETFEIPINSNDYRRKVRSIGANPFCKDDWMSKAHVFNYDIESIIHVLTESNRCVEFTLDDGTKTCFEAVNWNPYVIVDGEKKFYQRDFCWTLDDKRALIDSIYNNIECGKVVLRKHSCEQMLDNYNNGDRTYGWYDVVDGKQRLNTLIEFVTDKFSDSYGNYYSDLSGEAQHKFLHNQLITYCEMDEDCTDKDVLRTFLMVNFSGRPISQEHIDYVQKLYNDSYGSTK